MFIFLSIFCSYSHCINLCTFCCFFSCCIALIFLALQSSPISPVSHLVSVFAINYNSTFLLIAVVIFSPYSAICPFNAPIHLPYIYLSCYCHLSFVIKSDNHLYNLRLIKLYRTLLIYFYIIIYCIYCLFKMIKYCRDA